MAEEAPVSAPASTQQEPIDFYKLFPELLDKVDEPRNYLSERFVILAANIDRFFGSERDFQESNKSVFQLDLSRTAGYHGDHSFVFSGRAKLSLPNTEKRLRVLVETDPEQNVTGDTTQDHPVVLDQVSAPQKLSLAARYEQLAKDLARRWNFSTDAGIQLRIPLEPFARARASYTLPFETWRMKMAQSVFWFNTIGAGETSQVDFEHFLNDPILFRASSTATWLNDKQNFDLRQDFTVFHTLDKWRALQYQISISGITHPHGEVSDYVALMSYRQRLRREWIFLEVTPQLHFPKDKAYAASPAISFRLGVLFDQSR
jgi:hypothetical protein